ncbi:Na+/H+ antiporter subunit E [Streptomyces sodiiphilus]|uniref:Na+/H+ antiporter subunit E n=1 Tax=Streptomyces sodiiphilus TaxID=226217 RepID=A0ABN2NTC5_9ACTN
MTDLLRRTAVRTWRIVYFLVFFTFRFVESNFVVAWEIITPGSQLSPAIVELPLRCRTRAEMAAMANLLSLTPGTLTLELDTSPPTLWVHGTHARDVSRFRAQLRHLETRLLDAMRPVDAR